MKRRTTPATSLVGTDRPVDRGVVGRVASGELQQAVDGLTNMPLITWDRNGIVRLANKAVAEMLCIPLDEIVGKPVIDLAGPAEDIERNLLDFNEGRFVGVHTRRHIHVRGGEDRLVLVTSRAIEVDGRVGGITAVVPDDESGGLGRDTRRTWLDLVPVAVGATDNDWVIVTVSSEIHDLIDRTSLDVRGHSLLELVDPTDADELRGSATEQDAPRSLPQIRFLLPTGGEVEVCVLLAPLAAPSAGVRFALVGRIESYFPQQQDRIAELELRLRRIGTEVRAAGLLDSASTSDFHDHPEIAELSTRQWEILSRLLEGARVSTIAGELMISESTVRNHLSTIFQRFGVHSQAELIDKFRQRRSS
ncbi:MAG TPA: LuxR C-terminal-related transcriptional regulator [Acidimicrobiales bacterium]|nr:LuxR C-terminal-related transcriptional regulator [Acidimicrobiales bacterium]